MLTVAPDGAVHLDGPQNYQPVQSGASQPAATSPLPSGYGYQQPAAGGPIRNWFFNNPIPPQNQHRTGFWGEFLYLRPRNAEIAYALPIEAPVPPVLGNEVPIGSTALVDFEYEPAFRVGFTFRLREDSSIGAQYSYLRADASHAAAIDPADGVLRSLVSHPLGANTALDTPTANAALAVNYDLIDVDYRSAIDGCEVVEEQYACLVNYILGGRYARLDQEFSSNFIDAETTSIDSAVGFNGGGIRFGLEGERHHTGTGFYVFSRGVGNLMVGEFDANYRQSNTADGVEAFTDWSGGRIVPAIDLELGMGWVGPRRRLRLSGGYMVSTWFNVVKPGEFIHAAQSQHFDDLSGILTFDGLIARADWQF